MAPISDAIHVVSELPTDTTNLAGSIYYISGSNILAIRKEDNSGWVQINPDTDFDWAGSVWRGPVHEKT